MGQSEVPTPCRCCGYPLADIGCQRCGDRVLNFEGTATIAPGPGFFAKDLAHGFLTFFAASLALINRREFVGKLGLPIVANLLVLLAIFLGFFLGLLTLFEGLVEGSSWGWFEFLRDWVGWIGPVLSLVLACVSLMLLAPVIIETVIGPFLEPLAEVVEKIHGGSKMEATRRSFWQVLIWGVRSSAQILLMQVLVLIPCLILSLFGIGALLAFLVSAWFNALIWFELPFARRGYGLRHRRAVLKQNWARAIGFGLAFQVGMFIPIFNFILLTPAAAVAASSLYFHLEKVPRASTLRGSPSS